MIAITFTDRADADTLIAQINAYVGSTAIAEPIQSDDGWVVLVPVVSTSSREIDLPSMMDGKVFAAPPVVIQSPAPVGSGTLA